ncbi:MAG TPA: glutathione S-transferase N-terminal domain-containing protein [Kofleriaceae bacterium]|nr:glutathione S-transferase N-terminal domain-containing protein [Kofleriaceae bacterium]
MNIQLLHFSGCPNVDGARMALRDALAAEELDVPIEEIDVEDPAAPPWARGWGSPTILIDGEDVAGGRPSSSCACRLYAGGAPSVEIIRARIATERAKAMPAGVTSSDGAMGTIAVNDEREVDVELSPSELAELEDAIAEADRSESVSSAVVLAELDRIAMAARR